MGGQAIAFKSWDEVWKYSWLGLKLKQLQTVVI